MDPEKRMKIASCFIHTDRLTTLILDTPIKIVVQ